MEINIFNMNISIFSFVSMLIFLIAAPIIGCILAGLDRKFSARMQGRVGPKILQPYYDVRKLWAKEDATVNGAQDLYAKLYFVFVILAGLAFFAGANFLLCIFILTLAELFLIIAAYASRSPFAKLGAERETIQVMAYEPMILLMAVGIYMATDSFRVVDAINTNMPLIAFLPFLFIGFLYILTIKLRKSPFDISMAQHAHQELVRGLVTEFSGKTLALIEIAHWFETILFLGFTAMFIIWQANVVSIVIAVVVCLVVWFLEIWIDNNFARVKWQSMLKTAWVAALAAGACNIVYLLVFF